MSNPVCPDTGTPMHRDVRPMTLAYAEISCQAALSAALWCCWITILRHWLFSRQGRPGRFVFSAEASGLNQRRYQEDQARASAMNLHPTCISPRHAPDILDCLSDFCWHFGGGCDLAAITSEQLLSFLNKITEGGKQQTKHGRYSHLKAFFNFIKTNPDPSIQNPCDAPTLRKISRPGKPIHRDVVEKETIDEIILRTTKVRNRLILELMARVGMRIGEVLKLTPKDVSDLKLTIQSPKRGRDAEVVFIPRKVVERLRAYLKERAIEPENRIFPITYAAARIIVSKVVLRHANLSTTQRYFGKISDTEATRWIENLYG